MQGFIQKIAQVGGKYQYADAEGVLFYLWSL